MGLVIVVDGIGMRLLVGKVGWDMFWGLWLGLWLSLRLGLLWYKEHQANIKDKYLDASFDKHNSSINYQGHLINIIKEHKNPT
jgi:hypothetical protein